MGKMAHLMGSSAKNRLIYEILCECRKFGRLQADGSYHLGNSEKGVGARAGLSRETVSREAKSLKQKKLLSIQHNTIIVPDIKKLEEHLLRHS
jgi:CRP-like cAMP-binding protein